MYKISPDELKIETLRDFHDVSNFKSYEQDLVKFLVEDALDHQKKKISVTFLWFLKKSNELVGYITLLNDGINLEGDLKPYFNSKEIFYKSLPALKIGRLAVDDRFLRRGIGSLMVYFAISMARLTQETIAGCRLLSLDAKRNKDKEKDSIHFYGKLGFKILKQRKEATPMYLDLN